MTDVQPGPAGPAEAGDLRAAANSYAPFLTMLSMGTALLTLLLIIVGSLVTSHTGMDANGDIQAVGDSIPTWPFGEVWNIEMIHRVVAACVGFAALGLAITLAATEPRRWVRNLGYAALVCVVLQALLGGVRVLWASPELVHYNSPLRIGVAMVHATFGQIIFGLCSIVALATTQSWMESPAPMVSADTARTRRLGIMTTAMVAAQILLGAWVRHLRFVPDLRNIAVWIHIVMAMAVTVHVVLLSVRISNKHNGVFAIRQVAGLAVFFTALQIFFGLLAFLMTPVGVDATVGPPESLADIVRSGHVASGAMILAMCVVVTARSYKLLTQPDPRAAQELDAAQEQVTASRAWDTSATPPAASSSSSQRGAHA